MFETFIFDAKTDLGPLTPNWFEELTAKASRSCNGNVAESMATEPPRLEDDALNLPSFTPKLFQKPTFASPEFKGTPPSGQIMSLMESSPCLFESEKKSGHERDTEPKIPPEPEDTPRRFSCNSAQRISESLGAQINPDLSWSSSLNTPTSLSPTYILTKRQEQSSAVKSSEERIIFVRQLFPPVFKDDVLETTEEDRPFIDEIREKKIDTSSDEANDLTCGWKGTVPDAIEDGELRSTVESVLDGTEEVLSFFFTNRNSSLRRVRTRERIARRLPSQSQEVPESSVALRKPDVCTEPDLSSRDVTKKNRDCEVTQWTPLSLSDISCSSVEPGDSVESSTNQHMQHQEHDYASQHNLQIALKHPTNEQNSQSDMQPDALVLVSTLDTSRVSPSRRKTKSIYSRNSSLTPRRDIREQFYKPLNQHPAVPSSGLLHSTNRTKLHKPNEHRNRGQVLPSTLTLEKDVDMSQLCKAFAEDFSQDTNPRTSTVTCEEVEGFQSTLNPSSKSNRDSGTLPLCEQHGDRFSENNSSFPGHLGIQSQLDLYNKVQAVEGKTLNHTTNNTASSGGNSTIQYEASGCVTDSRGQAFSGFKTANDKIISLPQEAINRAKALMDEVVGDAFTDTITVSKKENSDNTKSTSSRPTPSSHVLSAEQKNSRLRPNRILSNQKKSAPHQPCDFSGFRTGRDGTINVSSSSLLKAKQRFKELEDDSSIDNPIEVHHKEKTQAPKKSVFHMKSSTSRQKNSAPHHPDDFSGFRTGRDRTINVSSSSLLKAKQMFKELDDSSRDNPIEVQLKEQAQAPKESVTDMNSSTSHQKNGAPHHPVGFSGFRTGRDRTINISSSSLLKAKQMFQELEDNPIEVRSKEQTQASEPVFDMNSSTSLVLAHPLSPADACSALTASQKADVSELCSLLEDANSQYEFTQAKPLTVNSSKPQDSVQCAMDKEWDPDDLTDINFDDSFSSDTEHHMPMQRNNVKSNKVLHHSVENVPVSEKSQSYVSSFRKDLGVQERDTHACIREEPKVVLSRQCRDDGFDKTILKVTSNETVNSSVSHSEDTLCGFRTAGGKKVNVSETALLKAKALLSCETESGHTEGDLKDDNSTAHKAVSGGQSYCGISTEDAKMFSVSAEASQKASNFEFVSNQRNANTSTQNDERMSEKGYTAVRKKTLCVSTKVPQNTTLDHFGSTANSAGIEERQDSPLKSKLMGFGQVDGQNLGFRTARGKSVLVSDKALIKARSILSETGEDGLIESDKCLSGFTKSSVNTLPIGKKSNFYKDEAEIVTPGKPTGAAVNMKNSSHAMPKREERLSSAEICHIDSGASVVGFSTGNGKRISVSRTALQKGIKFFDEEVESPPVQCNSGQHSLGTNTSSGKGISALAIQAVQGAKSLLTECDKASKLNCIKTKHAFKNGQDGNAGNSPSKSKDSVMALESSGDIIVERPLSNSRVGRCGFSTASGKYVSVSSTALECAKLLLDEETEPEPLESVKLQHQEQMDKASGSSGLSFGFSTASGKGVSVSEKALKEACKLLEKCEDEPVSKGNFGVAPDKNSMSKLCHTDSGAKSILRCSDTTTETVQNGGTKGGECSAISFGFSTASGKGVTVSKKALKEACKLLEECEDEPVSKGNFDITSDKNLMSNLCHTAPGEKNILHCSDKASGSSGLSFGFSTASGKGVSVSDKALKEACKLLEKCEDELLSTGNFDITPDKNNTDPGAKSVVRYNTATETVQNGGAKGGECSAMSFGFSTASGKSVSVSEKALKEACKLLEKCEDEPLSKGSFDITQDKNSLSKFCHTDPGAKNIIRSNTTKETVQNGGTKGGECSTMSFGFSTASGKGVSVSEKALKEACKLLEKCEDEPLSKGNSDITPDKNTITSNFMLWPEATPDPETNQCNLSYQSATAKGNSSVLSFQSNGLSTCTTTQQRYFEEEAEACIEALLKDEDHHNDALNGTSVSSQKNPRSGKRDCEFHNSHDQPPLKRRLLEEFDRTKTPYVPSRSSPNGVLNDRTVRCSGLLQSNVTMPHRTSVTPKWVNEEPELTAPMSFHKQFVEKMPVFVPPFMKQANSVKNQKVETSVAQDTKAQSVFVPPFKASHSTAKAATHTEMHTKSSVFVPVRKKDHPQPPAEPSNQNSFVPSNSSHSQTPPCRAEDDLSYKPELRQETPNTALPTEDYKSSSPSEEAVQCIQLAGEMQEMRIRKKKRQTIRPLPGSLFLAKTSGRARVSLRAAVRYTHPRLHPKERLYTYGVPSEVCLVNSSSAKTFKFPWKHFFKWETLSEAGGVQLADGGWLIPDNKGMLGKEQFYKALCDTPGVDPKLISEDWVYNHYRWIVWKRACMERAFPQEFGGLCLTPEQVLLQLKYRYDVEIDKSRRSALKKITERDDTSAKTMVLCVCDVETSGTPGKTDGPVSTIWLTDGWYRLRAALDPPLTALLRRGRLRVGDKLVTHGAELVGPQDACPPLEAPESLMLKISANSTRPARWEARLGYHYDPRPFQLPLDTLFSDGGVAGCVNILVLRSYPVQWMEKTAGGVFIFRSERAEEREARSHEEQKQKAMETLFSRIQAQLEKEEEQERRNKRVKRRTLTHREMESLQDGEDLHEAMESDPTFQKADLREEQLANLCSFRRLLSERRQARLQERVQQALREAKQGSSSCPNRDVSPVWKLAVCDSIRQQSSSSSDGSSENSIFLLNIWRPSMELLTLLKEGGRYRAYNLSTSESRRKSSSTAAVQLTATKKSRFEHMKVVPELLQECFKPRQCPSFGSLQSPSFNSLCKEVDVVGYVIYISDRNGPSPVLYLVDERMDFVSIRCSNTLRQLALEELVKPQTLLIVSNALHRQASAPIPALYAGEFTVFKTSSSEPHIQEQMRQLKSQDQSPACFLKGAEEKLCTIIPVHGTLSQSSSRTPGRMSDPCQNARNKLPLPITPVNKGTLVARGSEGNHPKSQKRRRGIEYLSRIPSPPPLSPLSAVVSPYVKKTFNPPRRSTNSTIPSAQVPNLPPPKEDWVKDEELALIDTQNLLDGLDK